jgi:hypothetical protein
MTVMAAKAEKVPMKTRARDRFVANRRAMKKVLSPSSEKKMRRKPETTPSVKGVSPRMP